jgi:hypothetical protein
MSPLPPDLVPAEEIFVHEKPGIRYYYLLKTIPALPEDVPSRPYIDEMDRILSQLYNRKAEAIKLEKHNRNDEVVLFYEQQVADAFEDPHAYFWLCKYYIDHNKPQDVRRICQAFLEMTGKLTALGYDHPYRHDLADVFSKMRDDHLENAATCQGSIE